MTRGLSAFDLYVLTEELQELVGGYIEKIYQLTRSEILVRVQKKQSNQKTQLFVRNGELLCTTDNTFDTPEKPSVFAMTLRKYLVNGTIRSITQHEFDRILKISIGRKEGDYTLVCELFSKGNIILLNPEGRIIRPLIKQDWAARSIKTGEMYVPPPSQTNPFLLNEHTFRELLQTSKKDLVRTLATTVNLSGMYAEELCMRAGLDKNTKSQQLSETERTTLFSELQQMLETFSNKKFQPTIVKKSGMIIDIIPLPFVSYSNMETEPIKSFSQGLSHFIETPTAKEPVPSTSQKKIEQLQRQLRSQQDMIQEFQRQVQQKKNEGDLIYLNFQACENILSDITILLKQKEKQDGLQTIQQNPLIARFEPTENTLIVILTTTTGKTTEVALDFRKSAAENAQMCYEESKKIQGKIQGALESIEHTKQEIVHLKENEVIEKKKTTTKEKQFWFERFRWFLSSEGNIIVAGRDAHSNDVVVKKYLNEGDRYAHADIHGAPSCVIKSRGTHDEQLPISEKTLKEACCFAASYSRAWNQFAEAQAYWVLPEQVSKTPMSGEYLPKGAFVIRGKRTYYRCALETAIGIITIQDVQKVMSGPLSSVAARSSQYVILKPGTMKKSDIAQKLAKIFEVSTETIEKALPPGNVTIVKTVGCEIP